MFGGHYFGAHYFGSHYFGEGGSAVVVSTTLVGLVSIYPVLGDVGVEIGPALDCAVSVQSAIDDVEVEVTFGLDGEAVVYPALLGSPRANRRLN